MGQGRPLRERSGWFWAVKRRETAVGNDGGTTLLYGRGTNQRSIKSGPTIWASTLTSPGKWPTRDDRTSSLLPWSTARHHWSDNV